ncbi:MAG: EAL domain-containing protein, partial [Agathobacter sp.]|nr:EAL domain-containing protein [Agathobacter sp.]
MIKRKHSKTRFLVVIATVVISVLAIIVSRQHIEKEMQNQLYDNLKDVAVQNERTIENLLNEKQNMLFEIANEINDRDFTFDSEKQIWDIVEWLKNYNNIYDFKRMGIIATDGTAYTTDGYAVKLEDDPYQYGIQGIANISSTLIDAIGTAEPINVFSVPVFMEDGKTVKGILFATYRTENFNQLINISSFDGKGYSYIIRKDGSVVVDSDKSPVYGSSNVFDTMNAYSEDGKALVKRVQTAMENNESGYERFYVESYRSMYYMPLSVDSINQTWYLLTMVPASVLEEKSEQLFYYQDFLTFAVAIVIIGLVLHFAITYQRDDKLLRNLAYLDPLTNGNNMYAFREQLERRKVNWGYMISVDIKDFKLVNSVCGIDKGNETIKGVWRVLNSNLGPRELAAHGGGDHFVVYLQEVYKAHLLERIQKMSGEIEALADELQTINLFPYFGIYEIKDMANPEEYYNCANQAKKLVKGNKTKNWAFYEEIDFQKLVNDKNIIDSFKHAVENDEFEIWYQPKYRAHDAQLVGAEALVRWRKSDGTLVPPYQFIPLFESNGMIITLDEYVFTKVCEQQKKWEKEGKDIFPVSVNISRASLYFGKIVDKYKQIVESCKIAPSMVPLEITESATVNNEQILGLVGRFREAGFSLCLDDFGNGYSSLAMLNLIRFDVLKLDKSLVDFIGDEAGEKLVVYTIGLAKSMGMSITAEGVETQSQAEFLNKLECDEIQG